MNWKLIIVALTCACWFSARPAAADNYAKFFNEEDNIADFTIAYKHLITRLQIEERFFSFYFLRNSLEDCVDELLPTYFAMPTLQLSKYEPVFVQASGNSMLLAIVCLKKLRSKSTLQKLAEDLTLIRHRRILFIHNRKAAWSTQIELNIFFQTLMELKFVNVALIHRDFAQTQTYHSFSQFPDFLVEQRDIRTADVIYPFRLGNVHGRKLRTLADQIEPNTMVYADRQGNVRMAGFLGEFILAFAKCYNFTLAVPDHYNSSRTLVVEPAEIRESALNDTIDVGMSLLTPQKEKNLRRYTYPLDWFQWFTMLPVEPPLETYQFFIRFFRPSIVALIFLIVWYMCFVSALQLELTFGRTISKRSLVRMLIYPWNMDMLRPLFNQSTSIRGPHFSRRILYILCFTLGGILNNLFSTNLAKWLTVPPHKQAIETFEQADANNLQIQVAETDASDIVFFRGTRFWHNYEHVFKVTKTLGEYQENLRSMDVRYAYVVTSITWPIIERRQKYFAQPIFRLSQELYYTKGALLSLPMNENCIYRDLLNLFGLRSREGGLLRHWYDETFFIMLKLKKFTLADLSERQRHQLLTLKEYKWIWTAYCIGLGVSMLTFLCERFGGGLKMILKEMLE